MYASGVEILGDALSRLGLRCLRDRDAVRPTPGLTAFNSRLLSAGGSHGRLPEATPAELARTLAPWADEARRRAAALEENAVGSAARDWVWADPQLSFLAPFWSDVLATKPAVILVHREPAQVQAARVAEGADPSQVLEWWDRYNRSALILCSEYPSLVVNYDELVARPKAILTEITDFLAALDLAPRGDVAEAIELVEAHSSGSPPIVVDPETIDPRRRTFDRLLNQLDGRSTRDLATEAEALPGLVDVTAAFYDETYYDTSCGLPYTRDEPHWIEFFGGIARSLKKTLGPSSVLDVGCAIGMLVEALREQGIDARGIDISAWAIDQVPRALRPFCQVGSVTEEIEGHYELITCIEVLEHLPPNQADLGVANLCRHAETVLFSSTPDDYDEPTHLNVEPSGYWAKLFLRHGFVRDLDYDASFLAPQAMLFRRGSADADTLIEDYERALWRTTTDVNSRKNEYQQLLAERNGLEVQSEALSHARDELQDTAARLDQELQNAERRQVAQNVASFERVRSLEGDQRRLAALVNVREDELSRVYNTKTFRYTNKVRKLYSRLRSRGVPSGPVVPSVYPPDGTYELWIELFDTVDEETRQHIDASVRALVNPPIISVIMPVYNPPVHLLSSAIESVQEQIYPRWELCIADDCSTDPRIPQLLSEFVARDERIKVVRREENGHISAASNTALQLATGDWVAPLDHDDRLAEHALALIAFAIADHPHAGLVYSDEDKIGQFERRSDPFFKPDFDPLLLLGQNFVSHLSVFRKDLVDRVGGYREGFEGSQDWDLTLRVSEFLEPSQVQHIPHVLYHWRVHAESTASSVFAKPYAVDAGRRAVNDHLVRTRRSGRAIRIGKVGHNRIRWDVPDPAPRVSVVVPTRDGNYLPRCLDTLLNFTVYPDYEVVVVDNSSRGLSTLQYLRGLADLLTVIRDERPFNFAALNNHAVRQTSGDLILLLNDDTEVIAEDWLWEMVSQLVQPGVGAVGPKLYFPDGRIQHGGILLGIGGIASHDHRLADRASPGYFGKLQLAHRMSAVTGACMLVRREAWDAVGGLDEVNLPIAYNDVDFCLRLREAGWDVVFTPHAQLIHHESISRGPESDGARAEAFAREVAFMQTRWGSELRSDPYYNPNLSLEAENCSLAWPPRVPLPRGPR